MGAVVTPLPPRAAPRPRTEQASAAPAGLSPEEEGVSREGMPRYLEPAVATEAEEQTASTVHAARAAISEASRQALGRGDALPETPRTTDSLPEDLPAAPQPTQPAEPDAPAQDGGGDGAGGAGGGGAEGGGEAGGDGAPVTSAEATGSDGGGSRGGGGSSTADSAGEPDTAGGTPAADASGMAALATGDLALVDMELAEHQRWGQAAAHVGAAGSTDRAAFVAETVGAGLMQGAASGFGTGLVIGLASRAVPVLGPILGGGMALHGLISGWGATTEAVGRFGEGNDTYETLANSIEAISAVVNVVNGVLNVISSIVSIVEIAAMAVAAGGAVAAVLTLGAAAPIAIAAGELAATCLEISEGITVVTTALDEINNFVLMPSAVLFRALHSFTSQADPRDVETSGQQLSAAASNAGGALGGWLGGRAAHIGAGRTQAPADEHAPRPGHETPPAQGEPPAVHFDEPPPAARQAPGGPAPVEVPMPAEPHAPGTPAPAPVDPHAPTMPAPAPVDPHAPTIPAPAPVDPHAPTVPAPAPVDPHAPTVPAPADPHAPTQPAPAPVDPHGPTMPAPEPVDPHAPTAIPDAPGQMPEIPRPAKVPEFETPDYGPELPDWHPEPSPYAPTERPAPMPAESATRAASPGEVDLHGSTAPAPADPHAPTALPDQGPGGMPEIPRPARVPEFDDPGFGPEPDFRPPAYAPTDPAPAMPAELLGTTPSTLPTEPAGAAPAADPARPAPRRISDTEAVPAQAAPEGDYHPQGWVPHEADVPPAGFEPPPALPPLQPGEVRNPAEAFAQGPAEVGGNHMYNEPVPNRDTVGTNVQRDHVIAQAKLRDITQGPPDARAPAGVLEPIDQRGVLTVLAETGAATPARPALPHTEVTFHGPNADVPQIEGLRAGGGTGHISTDIVEPSRTARLDAGYPEAPTDRGWVDQLGTAGQQYRPPEVDAALARLQQAEGLPVTPSQPHDPTALSAQLDAELAAAFPAGPAPTAPHEPPPVWTVRDPETGTPRPATGAEVNAAIARGKAGLPSAPGEATLEPRAAVMPPRTPEPEGGGTPPAAPPAASMALPPETAGASASEPARPAPRRITDEPAPPQPAPDAEAPRPASGGDGDLDGIFGAGETGPFRAEGPVVRVPLEQGADGTVTPARVLEVGAGPAETNLGLPPEPELVRRVQTDLNPTRPGVAPLDATAPLPADLRGGFDTVIINNPRGYQPNIDELGQALLPGGRIIVQGRSEVPAGQRGINPDMQRFVRGVEGGGLPEGYRLVPPDPAQPDVGVLRIPGVNGPATDANRPGDVMGGPFQRTTGGPVGWPNTRVVIEQAPPTPAAGGGAQGGGAPPAPVRPASGEAVSAPRAADVAPASPAEPVVPTSRPMSEPETGAARPADAAQPVQVRSARPLTPQEYENYRAMLIARGVPPDQIHPGEFTAFHPDGQGGGRITVGPDVNPLPEGQRPIGLENPANAHLDAESALSHESIGHREAELAGQAYEYDPVLRQGYADAPYLEEAQASARSALLDPNLGPQQRDMLMSDSAGRLRARDAAARARGIDTDDNIYMFMERYEPPRERRAPRADEGPTPALGAPRTPDQFRPQDQQPSVIVDPSLYGERAPAAASAHPAAPAAASATPAATPATRPAAPPSQAPAVSRPAAPVSSAAAVTQASMSTAGRVAAQDARGGPASGTGGGGATASAAPGAAGTAPAGSGAAAAPGQQAPTIGTRLLQAAEMFRPHLFGIGDPEAPSAAQQEAQRRAQFTADNQPANGVERINPHYPPPPGTPAQLEAMQQEISRLLAARARAEQEAERQDARAQQCEANQGPIQQTLDDTTQGISATQAHQQSIAAHDAANQAQQQRQTEAQGLVAGYPARAAGLGALTVPLAAWAGFTSLASHLPGDAGTKMAQMNDDANQMLDAFSQMGSHVETVDGQQPAQQAQLAGDSSRLDATGAQAQTSGGDLQTAQAGAQGLQQANSETQAEAERLQASADRQGQQLGDRATQRQEEATSLAAQMQAWATAHKAARQEAIQSTVLRLQAEGKLNVRAQGHG